MTHAASLADWFAFLSLGIAVHAGFSVFYFLFVEADLADFDPRPAVRRALDTDLGARAVVAVFNARTAVREAALDVTALLILLTATPEATS